MVGVLCPWLWSLPALSVGFLCGLAGWGLTWPGPRGQWEDKGKSPALRLRALLWHPLQSDCALTM